MKTKTAKQILQEKIGHKAVFAFNGDLALGNDILNANEIVAAMEEYKNQFSQLPAPVTDEQIEKMAESWFSEKWGDETFTPKQAFVQGIKLLRSLLNHTPVMGEGWMSVEDLPEEEGEFLCVQFRNGDIDYSGSIIMVCIYHYGFFESSETGDAFHPTHYHTLPPPPHQANT